MDGQFLLDAVCRLYLKAIKRTLGRILKAKDRNGLPPMTSLRTVALQGVLPCR